MKTISLESKIIVYESRDEIPSDILRLIGEAEEAAKRAYAAYSKFQVGAAILMNNGKGLSLRALR